MYREYRSLLCEFTVIHCGVLVTGVSGAQTNITSPISVISGDFHLACLPVQSRTASASHLHSCPSHFLLTFSVILKLIYSQVPEGVFTGNTNQSLSDISGPWTATQASIL